jgi:hypothetical protein
VQEISNARDAANRAVVLGPSLAATHAAIGEIRLDYDSDWAGADGAYQRALALEKGNAQIVERAASLAATLNRFEDALFFPAEPSTLTRFFRQRTTFSPSMLGGVGALTNPIPLHERGWKSTRSFRWPERAYSQAHLCEGRLRSWRV